jgi:hypothetical protein
MTTQRALFRGILPTFACLALLLAAAPASGQAGTVLSHQKISDTAGGLVSPLSSTDRFGWSTAGIGDLDNDGVEDMAVGAFLDDDGGFDRGAVYILFLNSNGTVKAEQKISDSAGGFTGTLSDEDRFGWSVAGIGDLNGDTIEDIAVGELYDDDSNDNAGALWILFLNMDGTVQAHQKINTFNGGFSEPLPQDQWFGSSVTEIGDFDGDTVTDLLVGAFGDSENGIFRGCVYLLLMNSDGTVKGDQKINETNGGFTGGLADGDEFGWAVANVGDLDGNGTDDAAVSANLNDGLGTDHGAVWILFLDPIALVVDSATKIDDTGGGFSGTLDDRDNFGRHLAALGDFDGDGNGDLVVGAAWDDGADADPDDKFGAVYVLFLNADGTVKSDVRIANGEGGFTGVLDVGDEMGQGLAVLGDLDGDGVVEIAAGASKDDDGLMDAGAVWVMFLDGGGPWSDLGNALPGTNGTATLTGSGPMIAAVNVSIDLTNALGSTLCVMFIGLTQIDAPFKGGVLVPSTTFDLGFFSNPSGDIPLTAAWPGGVPSGASFYFQYWWADAGGPVGFSASNAIKGTTP